MSSGWIVGLIAGAVILFGLLFAWFVRRRQRSSINDAIDAIAVERLEDIVVPDGMGGEIHIEHLILTARGILVVTVKRFDGVIFASERMDQWTAIGASGRSTFPNPLGSLYDRVAAVRQLVRDVKIVGVVVFPADADFSKGRPADIRLPEDLLAAYAKPDKDETARFIEAYGPHWERVRQAAQPASG